MKNILKYRIGLNNFENFRKNFDTEIVQDDKYITTKTKPYKDEIKIYSHDEELS